METKNLFRGILIIIFIVITSAGRGYTAVTELWQVGTVEEILEGEFQATGVTSEGEIIPTWGSTDISLEARVLWDVAVSDGTALIGTSGPSALYRVKNNKESEPAIKKLISSDQLGFTSVAESGGRLYAAEMPSGKIYRYESNQDTVVVVADLPDSHVFTMIADSKDSGLYIGGGPDGVIYHMSAGGNLNKLAALKGRNILSLTIHQEELYAGDDAGGLFKINNGVSEAIYSFPEAEINALASDGSHLFLGVNRTSEAGRQAPAKKESEDLARLLEKKMLQQGVEQSTAQPAGNAADKIDSAEKNISPRKTPEEASVTEQLQKALEEQERQAKVSQMFAGKIGNAVLKMKPGEELNVLYTRSEGSINDLAVAGEDLLVAAGEPGRVFRLGADGVQAVYVQSGQEQVTSLSVGGENLQALTTARGGRVYLRREFDPEKTLYTSKIFDAGLLSRWGRTKAFFRGNVAFKLRSGLTSKPDTYWTDWSDWRDSEAFESDVKASRYFQFRVRFGDEKAKLQKFELAYRTSNQRPQIVDFSISPSNLRDKILQSNNKEKSKRGGLPREIMNALQEIPSGRELSWQAMDLDGDRLSASLFYRPLGTARWVQIPEAEKLLENKFAWEDNQFADGYYEIKLEVSDEMVNPPAESFIVSRKIGPLLVDNTAPVVKNIQIDLESGLEFKAADGSSRLIFAQYRLNGGTWKRMRPVDGIFDSRKEKFLVTIDPAASSGDLIEIVVIDEGGNSGRKALSIP